MNILIKRCLACGQHNSKTFTTCVSCGAPLPERAETIHQTDADLGIPPAEATAEDGPRPWPWDIAPVEVLNHRLHVVVTNFDISFWNLVMLMVKAAFAAIPAIIIILVLIIITLETMGLFSAPLKH